MTNGTLKRNAYTFMLSSRRDVISKVRNIRLVSIRVFSCFKCYQYDLIVTRGDISRFIVLKSVELIWIPEHQGTKR